MAKPRVLLALLLAGLSSSLAAQEQRADLGPTGSVMPYYQPKGEGSGDPTMTAEAINAAAENFPNCLAGLWPAAARRGISKAVYDNATSGLAPDLHIMDLLDAQPEFTKSIWDYLDVLVTADRIAKGRAILAKYAPVFDAVERAYGVDRHIIAAIWGVETNYSTQAGSKSVLRSTATLACIGRRQAYFRSEFLDTLEIIQRGDIKPEKLVGSWAGAFGPTQFMPSAFKKYAVDFDGDGRRDVIDSIPDLIASTANNLKKDGWVSGASWGYEVVVPATLDFRITENHRSMSIRDWERAGITRANGQPFARPDDQAYLLVPAGVQGPGFLMLKNFKVIMHYNPAEAYAMAIGHLADRLRGDAAFVQRWPRYERVLSRAERLELQSELARHGFDIGEPDGHLGTRTRSAIRDFQTKFGRVPDGFASAGLLDELRAH
jgi:membrane-bound lytic murein transglycosylase B